MVFFFSFTDKCYMALMERCTEEASDNSQDEAIATGPETLIGLFK